jgi:hypothetical protein
MLAASTSAVGFNYSRRQFLANAAIATWPKASVHIAAHPPARR